MRKLLIVLALALLATSPVLVAETPAPPAPDTAETAPAPEEPIEIFLPERIDMACTAHQNCPGGGEVSCTGWDICQVFSAAVRCDNTTVSCSGCSVSTTCCDGRVVSCSGTQECTKIEGRRVLCDGGASGGGFCPFCPEEPF